MKRYTVLFIVGALLFCAIPSHAQELPWIIEPSDASDTVEYSFPVGNYQQCLEMDFVVNGTQGYPPVFEVFIQHGVNRWSFPITDLLTEPIIGELYTATLHVEDFMLKSPSGQLDPLSNYELETAAADRAGVHIWDAGNQFNLTIHSFGFVPCSRIIVLPRSAMILTQKS